MKVFNEHPNATKAFTYTNYELNHFSCTDRFFVSGKIFSDITGCMVVYNSLNLSNHNPLPLSVSGSPPVLANSQQVNCPNG